MKIVSKLGRTLVPLLTCAMIGCSENGANDNPILPPVDPEPPEVPAEAEIPAHDFVMGALFGFDKNIRNGVSAAKDGSTNTTYYNKPLFDASSATDKEWWDNLVEEYLFSGLDYMVPNCRGRLPRADTETRYDVDHGDPTRIKDLIAALKRRGTDRLKIAIFDDCPASWAAARNLDLYGKYTTVVGHTAEDRYPIEDLDDIYKYIWDYNLKLAFANFYGENQENNGYLLRYDGKPVLYMWSINGFLNQEYAGKKPDCTGRLKAILDRIHADFEAEFGEKVFICVDKAFRDRDPQVTGAVVEAMNDWFTASEQTANRCSYTLRSLNGVNVGVAVPGFLTNDRAGNRMLFDADHGNRLTEALDYFVKYKADLVFLEGFTDMVENAAYWRSTDTRYYDYPNQRLNLLRKYHSTEAWPQTLRIEAESCDYCEDASTGNSGGCYRKGDLDIKRCSDGFEGWCVTDTEAGEWLKWVELPFRSGTSSISLRYASQTVVKVRFDIDGNEGTAIELPATGGAWSQAVAATATFESNGWREVVLHIVEGNVDLNCFTISNEAAS